MAEAKDRYLLVSWGRLMKDQRCDPENMNVVHKWVDGEQLLKDPGVSLGRRDTWRRGWEPKVIIQVPATYIIVVLLAVQVEIYAVHQLLASQLLLQLSSHLDQLLNAAALQAMPGGRSSSTWGAILPFHDQRDKNCWFQVQVWLPSQCGVS
jgi:hypothetical protein